MVKDLNVSINVKIILAWHKNKVHFVLLKPHSENLITEKAIKIRNTNLQKYKKKKQKKNPQKKHTYNNIKDATIHKTYHCL